MKVVAGRNDNKMAGVEGFEPSHDGIKTRCLTAWLHPSSNAISGGVDAVVIR